MIPARTFSATVTLIKVVKRGGGEAQFVASGAQAIDLTPYLGDGGVVRTTKATREPAGGFSISFADRISAQFGDSLYAIAEPMDLVEIRASRTPWKYAGAKLPLLMRGYVSRVRRSRGMGHEGTPEQVVVIEGQDSGKLLQINQLLFQLAAADGEPFLDQFKLQAVYGLDPSAQPVSTFVRSVLQKVVNPKIEALRAVSSNLVKPFLVDRVTVPDGTVFPQAIAAFEGAVSDLLAQVCDRPWNEMFVADTEGGPELVFRPTPFKDFSGALILPGATDPGTVTIAPADIDAIDVSRSDSGVANFFWVPPDGLGLDNGFAASVALVSKVLDQSYANSTPMLYGLRRMEARTALGPNSYATTPSTMPTDQRAAAASTGLDWISTRTKQLELMNRDNALYEEGTIQVCGSETLVAGSYVSVTFGSVSMTAYAPAINHVISPLNGWSTSVSIERGTGWNVRDKMTGSPGFLEGRPGVYPAGTAVAAS